VAVRVVLRLDDGYSTTGADLIRLIGLGEDYLGLGAEGLVFGFLDGDLEIDVETTTTLSRALPGVPFSFSDSVDATLDPRRSWSRLVRMPCLTSVPTAGSPLGVEAGIDDLLATLASSPDIPRFVMPGRGLRPEHVPWLAHAGVRQWHLDDQARPGGSAKAYVDAGHVRSWRLLVDDAAARVARAARDSA
jgi:copper homeostasis protein